MLFSKENKALLYELVRTDFKLRYQGSVLGYVWSLLKPLLLFVILYIVFVSFLKIGRDIEHFPVYLLLGIVLWNFFTEMTTQSLGSIVHRGDLIRKIKIPRWMIVLSASISATINMFLSLIIVGLFMLINNVPIGLGVIELPFYIVILYLLALGFSLFLSAAYVKYRDVSYIWEIVLQAGFYATPIIYPVQMIKNELVEKILLLNPIAYVVQGSRDALITTQAVTPGDLYMNPYIALVPASIALCVLAAGILYFRSQSDGFAENI